MKEATLFIYPYLYYVSVEVWYLLFMFASRYGYMYHSTLYMM